MLSELLSEDKRKLYELEQKLAEFEKGNPSIQAIDISLGLEEMAKRLTELEKQANNESKARRDDMRRRVAHLKSTHTHVKQSFDVLIRRKENLKYEHARKDLFGGSDDNLNLNIDLELAENDSLNRSSNMINSYIAQGQETLQELLSQKDRLKNVQRKVLDIMNYLGISNSIMKAVERRDFTDKWIVISGMILTSGLTFLLWWYFSKK